MRFVSRDSTVSGRASPSPGERASSRMKSALPAARSVRASSSASESGVSPAAASASARASSAASGSSSSTVAVAASGGPDGRRVATTSHGRGSGLRELREDELRRVVEPVRVLDQDRRRHQQEPHQELVDDLVQPVAPERGIDLVHLRRRRHLGVERQREQRQPHREVRHHAGDERGQLRAGRVRRVLGEDARRAAAAASGAARTASRPSTARSCVRSTWKPDRGGDELLDEARLAGARLADELDGPALAHPRGVERLSQRRHLGLAPDERQERARRPRRRLGGDRARRSSR